MLLFSENGGYTFLDNHIEVDSIIEYNDILFPDVEESIIISKWKNGNHYYLDSSINRVFNPVKYNNLSEAKKEALKYVNEERIKFKEKFVYNN